MPPSQKLNAKAAAICEQVVERAHELDVDVSETINGATILDFGSNRLGRREAGVYLARICMADLARISIQETTASTGFDKLNVQTEHPLEACIAAQYAGWPFSTEHLFSMCSGPARANRGREEILTQFDLCGSEEMAVGVFETNSQPTESDVAEFAAECNCQPENAIICLAKTSSLPGTLQVVARSIETAMHKLFELGFDLKKVRRGAGSAPVPPIGRDDYVSMGWTNDAILYGAEVQLWIDDIEDLEALVGQVPSSSSNQFGRPFKEIFEEFDRDFYKVDRMLFSPAKVTLTCLESGKSATAGSVRNDLLVSSFGEQ